MNKLIVWGLIIAAGLSVPAADAKADCIIVQSEHMGIPLLPDWTAKVYTKCDKDHVKIEYKKDKNFLAGLFAPQLNNMPDQIYSLPDDNCWTLYPNDQTFTVKKLGWSKSFSREVVAASDSLKREEGINFTWETSAMGITKDTIADIPCDRLFLTGVGTSTDKDTTTCRISVDIRTAAVCEDNEPINHTYERFREKIGFDPLDHYTLGLVLGEAFNAPVAEIRAKLEQMHGFPIKIDLEFEIEGWSMVDGKFSYNLDVLEITEQPVSPEVFVLPSEYKPKAKAKPKNAIANGW